LGLKIRTLIPVYDTVIKNNDSEDNLHNSETDVMHIDDFIDRFLLVEECPVRLSMIRYNMLGEHQDCHIIDQYTFLEKNNKEDSFQALMRKNEALIQYLDKNGLFEALLKQCYVSTKNVPSLIESAVALCKRIGDKYIFCGCRRCNLCMNKPNFHVDTIYRCFAPTRDLDKPWLESRDVKAIKFKKIIQQIAFYFDYDSTESGIIWKVKDEMSIIKDINLWRCISNLCYWGNSSKFRFRLIAVFHASRVLYEDSSMKAILSFEDWHIHLFRVCYMNEYKSDTWFGCSENEIRKYFNLSEKRGAEWVEFINARIYQFNEKLMEYCSAKSSSSIFDVKSSMKKDVHNERTLLAYICRKHSFDEGVDRFLCYFEYCVISSNNRKILKSFTEFKKELSNSLRKTLKEKTVIYSSYEP
jgi:hypothetical protein